MGPAISQRTSNLQTSRTSVSRLTRLYYSKMFVQNKISSQKFIKQIEAVCKKTSYLNYKWAQNILESLKSTNNDELYSEYQTIFQENCRRDGQHELVFHALEIRRQFLQQIGQKYNTKESILDIPQLKSLIFECKCYFMVINWFHKISSLSTIKAKDTDDCEKQVFVRFTHEDSVYEEMIQAASKTFVQYLEKEQISRILEDEEIPKLTSKEILAELKKLKGCKKFHEKEIIIMKIQEKLLQDKQGIHQNMELIQRTLGKSKIFAHLLVIRQLGTSDVTFLWNQIYGIKYDHLLR